MKLSELIAAIGDDKVECQFLAGSLIGNQKQIKGGVQVTFATNSVSLIDLVADKPEKIGIVVWIPADKFHELREAEKAQKPLAS